MVHYTVMLKVLPPMLTLLPALVRKFKAALPPWNMLLNTSVKLRGAPSFLRFKWWESVPWRLWKKDSLCHNNIPKMSSWLSHIFEDKVFCTVGRFLKDTDSRATLTWTNDGVNGRADSNSREALVFEWLETGELARTMTNMCLQWNCGLL